MTVRLYTRVGCHLCEDVESLLADLSTTYPHALERHDIDQDPALRERYGWAVPVVVVDERWRLVTRIERGTLEQVLRTAAG